MTYLDAVQIGVTKLVLVLFPMFILYEGLGKKGVKNLNVWDKTLTNRLMKLVKDCL